jgi:hypothetical protein
MVFSGFMGLSVIAGLPALAKRKSDQEMIGGGSDERVRANH